MGWWSQNELGQSFQEAQGDEMWWGDGPADIVDNALDAITEQFEAEQGRRPTKQELRAGFAFSLSAYEEKVPEASGGRPETGVPAAAGRAAGRPGTDRTSGRTRTSSSTRWSTPLTCSRTRCARWSGRVT